MKRRVSVVPKVDCGIIAGVGDPKESETNAKMVTKSFILSEVMECSEFV